MDSIYAKKEQVKLISGLPDLLLTQGTPECIQIYKGKSCLWHKKAEISKRANIYTNVHKIISNIRTQLANLCKNAKNPIVEGINRDALY